MSKTVICLGDGGLDGKSPLMDLYILAQAKKKNPKVCFLPTASGDSPDLIKYFKRLFERYPCETSHLSLFNPCTADIKDYLLTKDVIFVGGGQSKSMLGLWYEWNVHKILREAYDNGVVLSGGSAGSVCWFDQCITDSIPGDLTVMNCLGFLPYSNCPHFASPIRRRSYAKFIERSEISNGYAQDDYAGLHFVDGELFRSVSNRPYANTYKLSNIDGKVVKERLRTRWLGIKEYQDEFIFNSPMFVEEYEHLEKSPKTDSNTSLTTL